MTVLVTAASEHGATGEIAARIGADLAEQGVEVEVKKPEEVHELAQYEAVVVGSAVYLGQWLKPARSFVDAHAGELAQRPTWLFSSGPIVGHPPTLDPHDATRWPRSSTRASTSSSPASSTSKLSWCEKVAVRAAHAREGDDRDWQAIDEWAAAIARELQQTRAMPRSP